VRSKIFPELLLNISDVLDDSRALAGRLKAATEGGADVVVDPVGGRVFEASLRAVAWEGRLLVVGFASGDIAQVPANLPLIKGFSVVGVRAGEYLRRRPEQMDSVMGTIDAWLQSGQLSPHICQRLTFDEVPRGLALLQQRQVVGKVVIMV